MALPLKTALGAASDPAFMSDRKNSNEKDPPDTLGDHRKWADFWRYTIGVNVIPADTQNKTTFIPWSEFQARPIAEAQHDQWKQENAFSKGIAIIPGRVWHNPLKEGYYFSCLDLDKQEAIDEICKICKTRGIRTTLLKKLASTFLVEQHKDDTTKAHIAFYSPIPFPKKSADSETGIEVKGLGEHGIIFCSDSIHKDGERYEIIGTNDPIILTIDQAKKLQQGIDKICNKHRVEYIQKHYRNLLDSDAKIYEGSRHDSMISIANSLLFRYMQNGKLERELKDMYLEINNVRCVPPLPTSEMERMWKDAQAYYTANSSKEKDTETNKDLESDRCSRRKKNSDQARKIGKALAALKVVKSKCLDLFVDQTGQPYAAIKIRDHVGTLPISTNRFKDWIIKVHYDYIRNKGLSYHAYENEDNNKNGSPSPFGFILSDEDATKIQTILKLEAEEHGKVRNLDIRVAGRVDQDPDADDADKVIYYDLATPSGDIVKITGEDWKIEKHGIALLSSSSYGSNCTNGDGDAVVFRRYSNQLPQEYPAKEYQQKVFSQFMNLTNLPSDDTDNRILAEVYIISIFMPQDIPKPVLIPYGEQGSGKSTFQDFVKELVDPCGARSLSFPRRQEELVQQLSHNYVAYYDNISKLPDWISDVFCRAVTGSGFSKRRLYTDDDDIIYNFRRCIGFNGINVAATKPDLLDRALSILLKPISKSNKRKLKDLWKEFRRIKPEVLGFIFDTLVTVLRRFKEIHLSELPRMADWTEVGEVISRCLGYPPNAFLRAYYKNIAAQNESALESSQVATAIIMLANRTGNDVNEWKEGDGAFFKGSMTVLLNELTQIAQEELKINTRDKNIWPSRAQSLSRRLNEIATNLRDIDITIERPENKSNHSKDIILKIREEPEAASDSHNESVDSTGSNIGSTLQPENGQSNYVPNIVSPSHSPSQNNQIYARNEEKREDGESGNFSHNRTEKNDTASRLDHNSLQTENIEERKSGNLHNEPYSEPNHSNQRAANEDSSPLNFSGHTPSSENLPVVPDSRCDENHAQIVSDIIGEDNGKTLENKDIISPTISKNRLAQPPLPLPKNTQKDPEGMLATLPLLTCLFCNVFATPIVFDMENHLLEKHKPQLVRDLPLKGKGYNMDYRIEYAVSMMMGRSK